MRLLQWVFHKKDAESEQAKMREKKDNDGSKNRTRNPVY